ncbi:hypothetical protein SVA_2823 [Sulfurifustis variabilis]|uniref:Cupin n=1 Tax=Sulfurifustis variabilis TaxID=1675686 RepID=A0A1B4VCK0_9GAMM|nr:hypothetical protein [Sulfurifustis variabilis]BAU49371.1 hypothetical protein SVA_2823 [Sulfurifustis variabilis]
MPKKIDRIARGGRGRALVPVLVLFLLAGCATTRQSPQTVRRVALENDEVLVVETTYPPKVGSTPMHTHLWPHAVYVVEGGTLQTTAPDGSVSTLELRPGQTLWRGVQSHSTRNIGPTTVRIVEVEIKNASTAPRPAEVFPVR